MDFYTEKRYLQAATITILLMKKKPGIYEGPATKLKLRVRFEIPPIFIKDSRFQAKIPDSKPSIPFKIYRLYNIQKWI